MRNLLPRGCVYLRSDRGVDFYYSPKSSRYYAVMRMGLEDDPAADTITFRRRSLAALFREACEWRMACRHTRVYGYAKDADGVSWVRPSKPPTKRG
jgi:hypothetical protein